MFSHLIFLILAVLLITFSQGVPLPSWITSMWFTAGAGALLYLCVLLLIYWQGKTRKSRKGLIYNIVQMELLIFLALYLLGLGGNAVFGVFQTANAILGVALYLGGLAVFHYSWAVREGESAPEQIAEQQVRLIVPFVIPFLFFLFMIDLIDHFATPNLDSWWLWLFELSFVGLTLFLIPPLLIAVWQCVPMQDSQLKERLEAICQKAGFKHGGILDWSILNRSHTAAILGAFPPFRYILFTKNLQNELSPEAIEAVLAHEIGHSQRRHLLWYPVIFFGIVILTALYTVWGSPWIESWFSGSILYPFAVFIPYALILWLYFRYVFGFFSRLFERQADLHCFELNIPPDHMINALDDVAKATGFTHSAPNWHHHSIEERIRFLEKAKQNPQVIAKHHRFVNRALVAYVAVMLLGVYLMEKV